MLSLISWREFFISAAVVLVIYYIIIGVIYYRVDLLEFLSILGNQSNKFNGSNIPKEIANSSHLDTSKKSESVEEPDEHTLLNVLLEELEAQIEVAAKKDFAREELLLSIQVLLSKYPNFKLSSFANSIENYIQSNVENQCSIHLTEEEVGSVWER